MLAPIELVSHAQAHSAGGIHGRRASGWSSASNSLARRISPSTSAGDIMPEQGSFSLVDRDINPPAEYLTRAGALVHRSARSINHFSRVSFCERLTCRCCNVRQGKQRRSALPVGAKRLSPTRQLLALLPAVQLNDLTGGSVARLEDFLRTAHLRTIMKVNQLKQSSPKRLYAALVGAPVLIGVVLLSTAPESSSAHLPTNKRLLHEGQQSAQVATMLSDLRGRSAREKIETAAEAHGQFMAAQGYGVGPGVDWGQRARARAEAMEQVEREHEEEEVGY